MKTIDSNFKLSEEDIKLSKRLFNDKIMRIIIPNGNNDVYYGGNYDFSETFPENKLSFVESLSYVEKVSNFDEYKKTIVIVTNCVQIITSVPKCLCRVLKTKKGKIVLEKLKNETFAQNMVEFIMDMSNNKSMATFPALFFTELTKKIRSEKWKTDDVEKNEIINDIELCGESFAYFSLYNLMGIEKRRIDL
jgi:hypothetical protein